MKVKVNLDEQERIQAKEDKAEMEAEELLI